MDQPKAECAYNNNIAKNDGDLYRSTLSGIYISVFFCYSKMLSVEEICLRVCHIHA